MPDRPYYLTTPIYYVNDRPHVGHAYTTILADVLARYRRLAGSPTFFLTGTDEHGQKVQQAAEKNGISPLEQCDRTVVRFRELWERLEIRNDDFIRTTEERHKRVVRKVLQDLYDRDEIYRAEYEGWYCVGCERFFTEKDLRDGNCPECGRKVDSIVETNYFFRMGKYRDWLIEHIETHPDFIRPAFRANETLGFLRNNELQDLCISRPKSRLSWGIELPFDPDFVTYVWFDALINYVSAVGYETDDERFAKWWPASCHLIGKDILTTHTVYWPTMLKAMGLEMPRTVFAHGWWLTGRTKMSKSLGNVVNPMEMIDKYGVDPFRYFLVAEMTLGQDASFTEESFVKRYNSDLANDLGNVASRILNMISRYCGGVLPDPGPLDPDSPEAALRNATVAVAEAMDGMLEEMKLDAAVAAVLSVVRKINVYLQETAPWALAKREGTETKIATCLYVAAECLRICSALLHPVMPEKMAALRAALGLSETDARPDRLSEFGVLPAGAKIGELAPLFPRIAADGEKEAETKKRPKAEKPALPEGLLTIDRVLAVKLKTALVLEAEKIEGADKLLKLRVDLGDERRQLVAGIARHYKPEELIGKTVVVVANLKPAKLRGIRSEGMLLAASRGDRLRLVTVDGDLPPGSDVK